MTANVMLHSSIGIARGDRGVNKRKPFMAHMKDGVRHTVAAQLRVLIEPAAEGGYVAQGLEIDYVSTGCTVEQVQERFADGLLRTIQTLLARNRPLTGLFKSHAPTDAWLRYMESEQHHELQCATVVDLSPRMPQASPFKELVFCQVPARAPA